MSSARSDFSHQGFTLIELLVVIAIIAILAVVVVLTLNPGQLILQSRDSTRLSDLASLQSAISLYQTDRAINGTVSLGSSSIVYVSLPDPAATTTLGSNCASLGLPSLPGSYTYHCAASSTFRKVDGSGWIPVNLSSISSGAPLGQLPIDPTNASSSRSYLTYTTNGTQYEVTSQIESSKYKLGGSNDVASLDGGTQTSLYEKGTNLTLEPLDYGDSSLVGYWTFDEGSGSIAYDYSGNNATGTLTNGPAWVAGRVGSGALSFNTSTVTYVNFGNPTQLQITKDMTIIAWANTTSTTGNNGIFSKAYNSAPSLRAYRLGVTATRVPVLDVADGTGAFTTAVASNSIASGAWQLVAMVYTAGAGSATFYINGVAAGGGSGLYTTLNNTTQAAQVGTWDTSTGANGFTGLIDDVRIYNRALSASEIQALYNSQR